MKTFEGYQHGINLGGWFSQCDHTKEHYETFIREEDFKTIANWGLDHVRIPVDYELVQDEKGEPIEEGFLYLNRCLQWCEKYHLNMILDLHKTAGYIFDDYKRCSSFFTDTALQNRFFSVWEQFSKRYAQYSNRLAFELLNEIVDSNVAEQWNEIAKQAIKIVRTFSTDIPILIGGVRNNSVKTLQYLNIPHDLNIVYNFHFYEPLVFTHQGACWIDTMDPDFTTEYPNKMENILNDSRRNLPSENLEIFEGVTATEADNTLIEELIMEAVKVAEERDVALYCGEYGVLEKIDPVWRMNWYVDFSSVMRKYKIGRASWTYRGMDFGLADSNNSSILPYLIKML